MKGKILLFGIVFLFCVAGVLASSPYQVANPFDARVAYPLDNTVGTAFIDLLGGANGSSIGNLDSDWVAGQTNFSNAFKGDGLNNILMTQMKDWYLGEELFISFWVNMSSALPAAAAYDFLFGNTNAATGGVRMGIDTDRIIVLVSDGGNLAYQQYNDAEVNFTIGRWNHVLLTIRGQAAAVGKYELWINGNNQTATASVTQANGNVSMNESLIFGGLNSTGTPQDFINATFDDIVIGKRFLLRPEIYTIYSGNYTGLITGPDSLNISAAEPVNNAQFNTLNLSFNATVNSSFIFNCSLYINAVVNQTNNNYSNGTDIPVNFSLDFVATTETNFTYFLNCYNNETSENTTTSNVYIDNVLPNIVWTYPLNDNTTLFNKVINNTLNTIVTLTDPNLFSWQFNISLPNGTTIYNFSNSSLTGFTEVNISEVINLTNFTGLLYATAKVCDGHTDEEIHFKSVIKNNNELIFDGVKINLADKSDTLQYDYEKKIDRYKFSFTSKTKTTEKKFIVQSPYEITILNGKTRYKGHLVTGDKWIDFEMAGVKTVDVKRLAPNIVEVSVKTYKSTDNWDFDSIGELNCFTESRELFLYDINVIYDTAILSEQLNTVILNMTYNSTFMGTVTGNLTYNNTPFEGTVTDFGTYIQVARTVEAPSVIISRNITLFWNYTVDGVLYNTSSQNQSVSPVNIDNCSFFSTNSLNFTLRDSNTEALLNGTIAAWVKFWTITVTNFSEVNLSWQHTTVNSPVGICFEPPDVSFHADIQLEYESTGYSKKTYYFVNTTLSNNTRLVDLYLDNGTTQVTLKVTDFDDNAVPNVLIKIQKYDLPTNSYRTVEIVKTDAGGFAYAQMVLNTVWYQFILEFRESVVLQTLPTKLVVASKNFRINIDAPQYFEQLATIENIQYSLTFNNATKIFSFTLSDTTGNVNEICLRIVKRGINADFTLNDTCVTSTSTTILGPINEAVGKNTYIATGYIRFEGNSIVIDILSKDFDATYKQYGVDGIFVSFFLALAGMMIGIWNPLASIVILTLIVIGTTVLGLFHLSYPVIAAWLIMATITIYRLSRE